MKKIKIATLQGSKVYFTEADSLSQQFYCINRDELMLKLKLWLLLSDHVMIAGSHIFESELITGILKEHPLLVESGAVIPDLRDECRDYLDFVELKQEEGDPCFQKDPHGLREMAHFLNEHTQKAVLWTAYPLREAFRDTLVKDLLNKHSVLRRKLIGVNTTSLQKLTWELGNISSLSRVIIGNLGEKYLGRKKGVLLKYANILYYLYGAAHLESEPVLHPEAFTWGMEKLLSSTKSLVRTDEQTLFQNALGEFAISDQVLEKLTFPLILEIRTEKTARRFRDKWHRIIEHAKRGHEIDHDLTEYQSYEMRLLELIRETIGVEKERSGLFREGKKILSTGSLSTSVITSFVIDPTLGFASLILELSSIDPLLAALERKLGGTEISLFCTRLQDLAFEHQIHSK
jgi:hypothetical protein